MASTSKTSSKSKDRKTLVLLDSHAIIHRAYHALPDFASSKGEPTGALYGLTTMLLGIIEKFKPEYIVACYDLPQPTYRHIAYEAYKAGRRKTDDALVTQLQSSRKVFEAFGIPMYDLPGFEADDMLGTIVEQVVHEGKTPGLDDDGVDIKIVIASGDMDTMQLIEGEQVLVYTLKKGIKDTIIYDEAAVLERFGFGPRLLPDYKGLRGDPSDNIIGIAGIGEKTATILISEFGTIESLYAILDKSEEEFKAKLKAVKITDRIIDLLIKGRDEAVFSKALATIRRDAPIEFKFDSAKWVPNVEAIDVLFRELEFRTLINKVKQVINGGLLNSVTNVVATEGAKKTKKGAVKKAGSGDFDEDGNEITPAATTNEEYYVDAAPLLKEKLKVASWVLDTNKNNPTLEDVYFVTNEKDADKAMKILEEKIKENNLSFIFDKIEAPLIPIVEDMTKTGVTVNVPYLIEMSKEYHTVLSRLEKEIHKLAGMEFNVASPKQLGEVLYDKLNLGGAGSGQRIKKTAGGAKSTKESELEKLRDAHPIIGKILEYRELAKILGTYVDVFPKLVDSENRVHAGFSQTGAATGRMSSHDPSLQNIPIKSELGRRIRHAFIASKGKKLVALDYSQIELRIAAFLSGDKNLIEIFKDGIDVHTGVAARVFKVPESEVTKDMRRKAKVINFGILYGMGVNALRTNLGAGTENGVSREEAQTFYSEYFSTFTGIASYLEEVKRSANALGYTKTLFGRRRHFEGIKSKLPFIRASAERMAINAPIQGTQADITKLAMLAVHEAICKDESKKTKLLMQIHDELIFEIDEKLAKKVAEEIQGIMEGVLLKSFEEYVKSGKDVAINDGGDVNSLQHEVEKNIRKVPINVSMSIGDNWGDMK